MTLRLSWEEVAALVSKHVATLGLKLGPPHITTVGQYGYGEREIEAAILEFPVITEAPFEPPRFVEPLMKETPLIGDDVPF